MNFFTNTLSHAERSLMAKKLLTKGKELLEEAQAKQSFTKHPTAEAFKKLSDSELQLVATLWHTSVRHRHLLQKEVRRRLKLPDDREIKAEIEHLKKTNHDLRSRLECTANDPFGRFPDPTR